MNILIAIDSFKGSISSEDAGRAAAEGVHNALPDAAVTVKPLADGGEGTSAIIGKSTGSIKKQLMIHGPSGNPVSASYYICDLPDISSFKNISDISASVSQPNHSPFPEGKKSLTRTAVIDTSSAAGLQLLNEEEKNPLYTSTFGLGEMIRDALDLEVRSFIIGLGGSSTNDGGVGMLSALGYRFKDKEENPVPMGASGLNSIHVIDTDDADPRLSECHFILLSDVDNPLCGPAGASLVFSPQKFAGLFHSAMSVSDFNDIIIKMDMSMRHYASVAAKTSGHDVSERYGAGAAGGLGFAFMSFTDSEIVSGADYVIQLTGIYKSIMNSDLIITGEGSADLQTSHGKAPLKIASAAKRFGVPVVLIAGNLNEGFEQSRDSGITAFFPIQRGPASQEEAMLYKNTRDNIRRTSEEITRIFAAGSCSGKK